MTIATARPIQDWASIFVQDRLLREIRMLLVSVVVELFELRARRGSSYELARRNFSVDDGCDWGNWHFVMDVHGNE